MLFKEHPLKGVTFVKKMRLNRLEIWGIPLNVLSVDQNIFMDQRYDAEVSKKIVETSQTFS